jgi:hypothetical protein
VKRGVRKINRQQWDGYVADFEYDGHGRIKRPTKLSRN